MLTNVKAFTGWVRCDRLETGPEEAVHIGSQLLRVRPELQVLEPVIDFLERSRILQGGFDLDASDVLGQLRDTFR